MFACRSAFDGEVFMEAGDTIAAISSPPAPSARIIVRLSGPRAGDIVRQLQVGIQDEWNRGGVYFSRLKIGSFCGTGVSPVLAGQAHGQDTCATRGTLELPVQIYYFPGPHSYTGEEVVELHAPGNPLLARMILEELIAHGARPAEAGEFTARAYFSGRIDLTQAEGVAAAIHAQGEAELNAGRRLMAGELARRLKPLSDLTAETLALVEAGIDFAEEGISFLPVNELRRRVTQLDGELEKLVAESARFERISHEPAVVLAGRPNAGKSTLLNSVAGQMRAVVSATSGTTRDAIWAEVELPRGRVRVTDVAGIGHSEQEPLGQTEDNPPVSAIERQMHSQAQKAIATADVVVLVVDLMDERPMLALSRVPDMIVRTKADLNLGCDSLPPSRGTPGEGGSPGVPNLSCTPIVSLSAHTGEGIEQFKRTLDLLCFGESAAGAALTLNSRHLQAIAEARAALECARACMDEGMELLASELREALDALGRITGQITPDDLLGRIFSSFCIGK